MKRINLFGMTRRKLLTRFAQLLATGGLLTMIFKFIRGTRAADFEVCFQREPTENEVIFKSGVYLVGLDQGAKAFSSRCPHLGCSLTYNQLNSSFQCPCHGSRFSLNGHRLQGPARKDMTALKWVREGDKCGSYTVRLPIS